MIFGFNILGMLVLFILVILYFSRNYKDKFPYKLILLTTYVSELLYIVTYHILNTMNKKELFFVFIY